MKHPITQTRNGSPVYVDLIHSYAAAYVAQNPQLLGVVRELLEQVTTTSAEVRLDKNMGRVIGNNYVVETTEKDTILYAQRLRDTSYTRFVKNGSPLPTPYLSIILRRDDEGSYELHDLWIGRLNPPRPGSGNETAKSKSYWANHAFVFDGQPIQARTITKVCPY